MVPRDVQRDAQRFCRLHRTSGADGDNIRPLKVQIATLVRKFMAEPSLIRRTPSSTISWSTVVMKLATISRITGVDRRHLGESLRSFANLFVYVNPIMCTVLAASFSNDFLGRLFLHIDTMSSDESAVLCGRAFNTTKNRFTNKPMLSVGDACNRGCR